MKRTEKYAEKASDFEEINRLLDQICQMAADLRRMSERLYYIAKYELYDQQVHDRIDEVFDSKEE